MRSRGVWRPRPKNVPWSNVQITELWSRIGAAEGWELGTKTRLQSRFESGALITALLKGDAEGLNRRICAMWIIVVTVSAIESLNSLKRKGALKRWALIVGNV
jgi:hypothetical protein